jgi:hypothetical protein
MTTLLIFALGVLAAFPAAYFAFLYVFATGFRH